MKNDFVILSDTVDDEVVYQGRCTFADLAVIPAFADLNKDTVYFQNEENKQFLKQHLHSYRIVAVIGTWCSDSQAEIPQLKQIVDNSNFPVEQLELIALDRDKKGRSGEEHIYNITLVPTFILFDGDREAGRITELPQTNLQQDLVNIIRKDKY